MGYGNKIIVVGLGNPILSDDSVGIRVARVLNERITQPGINVVEASIAGLDFLDFLTGYDKAIIVDAVNTEGGRQGRFIG